MLVTVCNTCKKILDDTMPVCVCAWQEGETLSFRKWTEMIAPPKGEPSHFCTPSCAIKFFEDWLGATPVVFDQTFRDHPAKKKTTETIGRKFPTNKRTKMRSFMDGQSTSAVTTKTVPAPVETDPVKKIVMDDEGWA